MSTPRSFAEYFHEQTKYSPEGLRRHQHELDWSKEPFPYKQYTKGQTIDLTSYLPDDTDSFSDSYLVDIQALTPMEREKAFLSHLLYFTNGVTAVVRRINQRPFLMRAAPSAGGLYPTEIYLAARGVSGLTDGLYNYQVANHSLVLFWEGDPWPALEHACFDHDILAGSDLVVILSAVFYRSAWRYEDRAYRRIFLDTGHIMGNLTIATQLFRRTVYPIGGFIDDELNDLLFLPRGDEEVIALAALPKEAVALSRSLASPAACPSARLVNNHRVPHGSRLMALHEASKMTERPAGVPAAAADTEPGLDGDKYTFTFGEAISGPLINWQDAIASTILHRRSTRAYSGQALSREELGTLLDFTYHPELYANTPVAGMPRYFDLTLLETFLAVHAVEGMEEGCYYYAPQRRELRQIRFKNFRAEVQYLCLGQELGLEAGVVLFHTADLPRAVEKYGERAYRYLHLDAGHLGQRLNLAAMRLGLGVSGIGGFFDDQVNELLGIPEREAVIYITTLGRPATG